VIVLGFGVWQRRFGGRADVVGQALRLDDTVVTIVGVMPSHFVVPDRDTEAWTPLRVPRVDVGAKSFSGMIFNVVARLRPGVTPDQAATEATARGRAAPSLGQAGLALFGGTGDIRVVAVPARDAMAAEVRPAVLMLLAGVGLLFGTAVASIVVLQSSRVVRRRRDISVRSAIGARNGRVALVWLLESFVLGTVGGISGIALSLMLHRAIPAVLPPDFPRIDDIVLDMRVALFAAGLTLLAGLVCGVVPAMQSRDKNLQVSLSSDSVAFRPGDARRRAGYARAITIAAQVAIACVLLVGTGLLARSFMALLSADRGFDPRNVITVYATRPATPIAADVVLLERARERISALPGVTDVGIANALPFVTLGGMQGMTLPSPDNPAATIQAQTLLRVASPEYFAAMGLRILNGRPLDHTDTSTSRPVVVVNRTFASNYLGATTVGAVLPAAIGSREKWEVVGVVEDMRQGGLRALTPSRFGGVTDPSQPEMFFTYQQWDWNVSEIAYVVRTAGDPAAVAATVRAIVSEENPSLTIESVATMDDLLMSSLARPRTYAFLVACFALFATVVAVVGLFGVLAQLAAQRRRDIGVRTALGATPSDILRFVTREVVLITLCGIAVGLSAALIVARGLATMLYGVDAHDVATFVAVPAVVTLAAVTACSVPAYRASRVNPVVALRSL
jgi:predicted permease